jgi:hypothetical protein
MHTTGIAKVSHNHCCTTLVLLLRVTLLWPLYSAVHRSMREYVSAVGMRYYMRYLIHGSQPNSTFSLASCVS